MRHDGATFAVELTVTQLQLNGRPAFTAYMRDISERIESDRRLVIANGRRRDVGDGKRGRGNERRRPRRLAAGAGPPRWSHPAGALGDGTGTTRR